MLFKVAAILALAVTGAWAFLKPGWDSICAALAALATVIGAFAQNRESAQSQTVGPGGIAIQAGRDASVRDVSNNS